MLLTFCSQQKKQQRFDAFISNYRSIASFYQFVLLLRFIVSFYQFVLCTSLIKNFHFKARNLKSIAIDFEAINTCLKNITTVSLCSADTSKKIFVENFELIEVIIDIEVDDFVEIDMIFEKIENETTTIDCFCFEIENVSTIIINNLKIVVDIFDERFDFLFWLIKINSIITINFFETKIDETIIINVFENFNFFLINLIDIDNKKFVE